MNSLSKFVCTTGLLLSQTAAAAAQEVHLGAPVSTLIEGFAETFADSAEGIVYSGCFTRNGDPGTGRGAGPVAAYLVLPRAPLKVKNGENEDNALLFWIGRFDDEYSYVNVGLLKLRDGTLEIDDAASGGLGTQEVMRRIALPLSEGNLKLTFSVAEIFKPPMTHCQFAQVR